jgi:hypothetical protein
MGDDETERAVPEGLGFHGEETLGLEGLVDGRPVGGSVVGVGAVKEGDKREGGGEFCGALHIDEDEAAATPPFPRPAEDAGHFEEGGGLHIAREVVEDEGAEDHVEGVVGEGELVGGGLGEGDGDFLGLGFVAGVGDHFG